MPRPICRRRQQGNADRFAPNAPQPPAVAFPPFGRVRPRSDLPRPVAFLCAVVTVKATGQPFAVPPRRAYAYMSIARRQSADGFGFGQFAATVRRGNRGDNRRQVRRVPFPASRFHHAPTVTGSPWRSSDGNRATGQPSYGHAVPICRERFGTVTGSDGNGQRFATVPPNAPQPPAVAFPPFGQVRPRPDSPPRPVPFLCAVA